MLEANCSDEPNQTPSARFPNTHILSVLQAATLALIYSLWQMLTRPSSDVAQVIIYPLKLVVLLQ